MFVFTDIPGRKTAFLPELAVFWFFMLIILLFIHIFAGFSFPGERAEE